MMDKFERFWLLDGQRFLFLEFDGQNQTKPIVDGQIWIFCLVL
jgi:hypothetical protein